MTTKSLAHPSCFLIILCVACSVSSPISKFSSPLTKDYIQRGNLFCLPTTCNVTDTYVVSCKKNLTSDTCHRCPNGTELKDITRSRLNNIKCRRIKQCPPKTRPVNYEVKCKSIPNYTIPCECDTSRGYCHVDPCDCREKTCSTGLILQQNCGCSYATVVQPRTTRSTIAEVISSKVFTQMSTESSNTVFSSPSTTEQAKHKPVSTLSSPSPTVSNESVLKWWQYLVGSLTIGLTILLIAGFCYNRKRHQKQTIKIYTGHGTVIYQAENMQHGKSSTLINQNHKQSPADDSDIESKDSTASENSPLNSMPN